MPDFTGTTELASADDLEAHALIFGLDPEMTALARKCGVCDAPILVCDNGWIDAKAVAPDPGTVGVIKMGSLYMMAGGAVDGGSMHTIHEHQPEGSS